MSLCSVPATVAGWRAHCGRQRHGVCTGPGGCEEGAARSPHCRERPWRPHRPGIGRTGREGGLARAAGAARLGSPFHRTGAERASRRDRVGDRGTRRHRHPALDQAGVDPRRIGQRRQAGPVRVGQGARVAGGFRSGWRRTPTGGPGRSLPGYRSVWRSRVRCRFREGRRKRREAPRPRPLKPRRGRLRFAHHTGGGARCLKGLRIFQTAEPR